MKYTTMMALLTVAFLSAAIIFSAFTESRAQDIEPATHLWLYSNTSTVYVPAATKEGCQVLVSQAAMLNSSTGHCYFKDQFLGEIKCNKSLNQGGAPVCTMSDRSTR